MKDISLLILPLLRPWLFGVFFVLFLVVGIAFAYAVVLYGQRCPRIHLQSCV
ncbi:hypothetical protein LBMAG57_06050 [Verrucomicrobiota bacterium]|jgi:hypothetical protein|nr:hypothetical protein LBMAG57_06050 [Verrucomicrobiota bacterium]